MPTTGAPESAGPPDGFAAKGRNQAPAEIRFTTWMLRYNSAHWIRVDAMGEEWTRARVNAKLENNGIAMTTENVTALHVLFPAGLAPFAPGTRPQLRIDGATLTLPAVGADKSLNAGMIKAAGGWRAGELPANELRKAHGLQGPIDDAFMDSFMMVRPTGTPLSEAMGKWEKEQADYAVSEWVHVFRGEPRVKATLTSRPPIRGAQHRAVWRSSSNAVYKRFASSPRSSGAPMASRWEQEFDANHAPCSSFRIRSTQEVRRHQQRIHVPRQSNNDMRRPSWPTGRSWTSPSLGTTTSTFRCSSRRRDSSTKSGNCDNRF